MSILTSKRLIPQGLQANKPTPKAVSSNDAKDFVQNPLSVAPLKQHHLEELAKSAIAGGMLVLNFRSVEGATSIDLLTSDFKQSDRRNDGRIRDKWLKRYDKPGWWSSGWDPLARDLMEWGCFKPDRPYEYFDKKKGKQKVIKYEHPANAKTRAFFPIPTFLESFGAILYHDNPEHQQESIRQYCQRLCKSLTESRLANREEQEQSQIEKTILEYGKNQQYQKINELLQETLWNKQRDIEETSNNESVDSGRIERLGDFGFWDSWLSKSGRRTGITEGNKKGVSSFVNFFLPTISLPGINNGYRTKDENKNPIPPKLIPELGILENHNIVIFFDEDEKDNTRRNVTSAASRTSLLLEEKGNSVQVAHWDNSLGKGLDDYIYNGGKWEGLDFLSVDTSKIRDYQINALNQYKKLNTFTPDIVTNEHYINIESPKKGQLLAIKSGVGTGKTTNVVRWIENDLSRRWFNPGSRNSLLHQFCEKSGFVHIHDTTENGRRRGTFNISTCFDSFLKIPDETLKGRDWIVDEATSVTFHLLFSPTIKNREAILEKLERVIKTARSIVLMDGFLLDFVVNYWHDLSQFTTTKIQNISPKPKPKWYLLEGAVNEKGMKKSDRSPILHQWKNGTRPALFSDSQTFIEAMADTALRIDSKTVSHSDSEEREFCSNPDEVLRDRIERGDDTRLAGSPTILSGLSIDSTQIFSESLGCYFGVIGTADILQQQARIRENIDRRVWVNPVGKEESDIKSYIPEIVSKQIAEMLHFDLQLSLYGKNDAGARASEITEKWVNSPHNIAANHFIALRNYEKSNPRESLEILLSLEGYEWEYYSDSGQGNKQEQSKKKEVKLETAEKVFKAGYIPTSQDIPDNDYTWELPDRSPDNPDGVGVKNHQIRKRFPDIEYSEQWSSTLVFRILFGRNFTQQCENLYLINHLETAQLLSERKYFNYCKANGISLWKWRTRYAKLLALKGMGISYFLNPDNEWDRNTPELIEFCRQASSDHAKKAGINQRGLRNPVRYVNDLLKSFFGLKPKCKGKFGSRDCRRKVFELGQILDPERDAITSAIAKKYEAIDSPNWEDFLCPQVPENVSLHNVEPLGDTQNCARYWDDFLQDWRECAIAVTTALGVTLENGRKLWEEARGLIWDFV